MMPADPCPLRLQLLLGATCGLLVATIVTHWVY